MSTELRSKTQSPTLTSLPQRRIRRQDAAQGKWWKPGLLVMGAVAVLTPVAAGILGIRSSQEMGPELMHTVKRSNLLVTVTEQGTLESSENTEIKCQVRGASTVIWVIENGAIVEPGDELVRLDTLVIEDAVSERSKYAHWSRSSAERSRANVVRAELAIAEYEEGRYRSQLLTMEKDLAVAESNLRTAESMLRHAKTMLERGFVSKLDVESRSLAYTQAELWVENQRTQIEVLKEYTRKIELETLKGDLNSAKARLEADEERAKMDATRRDEALEELKLCVVRAERPGLVIYPSAARWRNAPEIAEGITVHKDRVLLLMPDLSRMQVKLGIHESIVDRIQAGMPARVTLPDKSLNAEVTSVAKVAKPASWWTGNEVLYETIVELPSVEGLKPGMSAAVEVVVSRHKDVLTIPVAAIVDSAVGEFCWIKTAHGPQRRFLKLGNTNDVFTVVEDGLQVGDKVVLNALAFDGNAQTEEPTSLEETEASESESPDSVALSKPKETKPVAAP